MVETMFTFDLGTIHTRRKSKLSLMLFIRYFSLSSPLSLGVNKLLPLAIAFISWVVLCDVILKGDFDDSCLLTKFPHLHIVTICSVVLFHPAYDTCISLSQTLWESLVCNDYLDETHPDTQLNPTDPYVKAKQRILVERWGKVGE